MKSKKGAGQMVYVLTVLQGGGKNKAWQPVAVVTDPDVASSWTQYGGQNTDFMPLELDDVKDINPDNMPTFVPRSGTPSEERAQQVAQQMEATIKRLQGIIDQQTVMIKKLQRRNPTASVETDTEPPPKPMEGSHPFADRLDTRGLADYIETYASYPVDNEFVYEKFRGAHATLQLVAIADLKDGGRDANQQNKGTEDKYFKQDIRTQPPAVVEDGIVIDGNHRLRANRRKGLTHMWAYVVMDGE